MVRTRNDPAMISGSPGVRSRLARGWLAQRWSADHGGITARLAAARAAPATRSRQVRMMLWAVRVSSAQEALSSIGAEQARAQMLQGFGIVQVLDLFDGRPCGR